MRNWLPAWCFNCQKLIRIADRSETPQLCRTCYRNLPYQVDNNCQKCGLPHETSLCSEKWAEHITRFTTVFKYEEPIPRWISNLKYSRSFNSGKVLLHFVNKWFYENSGYLEIVDFLVPVPIHHLRLRRRGFNQTSYLLRTQFTSFPKIHILRKVRQTPHQVGLSKHYRGKNLKNAFSVATDLSGKTILVFDDVCTTGRTLGEVTHCLKQAGAERIDMLVLGRAL